MVFGPLEHSQVLVPILQTRIYANRLSILARSFAVSPQTNEHYSAEVSNPRVRWLLTFGCGEMPERFVETIILKRFERALQSITLRGTNGKKRFPRNGKTSPECKEK